MAITSPMNPSWRSQIAALHIVIEQSPQITFCMTNEQSQEICGQLFFVINAPINKWSHCFGKDWKKIIG